MPKVTYVGGDHSVKTGNIGDGSLPPEVEQLYRVSQGQGQSQPQMGNPALNTATGMVASGQIGDLIKKYFPQDQWQNAMAIMHAESGGNVGAVGDNYPIDTGKGPETIPSYGLFQIRGLPGRPNPQTLLNPEANVAYAAQLYKSQGWRPWSTAKKLGLS